MSKQDNQISPSTQISYELKDSHTPITAGNIKENIDTLYNGRNTAKKQLKPLQPSSDQSKDQALDTTPRSSPEPEMQEEYTNRLDREPNQTPPGEPPAHVGIITVHGRLTSQPGLPL